MATENNVAPKDVAPTKIVISAMSPSAASTRKIASEKDIRHLKTFVINLDRRPDRWVNVSDMLTDEGFDNISRLSAIDGRKMAVDTQVKQLLTPEKYDLLGKPRPTNEDLGSLGAIGCYLSHYKAWLEVVKRNEPCIIMEDDIIFFRNWDRVPTVKDKSKLDGYDFVLLGYNVLFDGELPPYVPGENKVVPYNGRFFGLQFYYITPKAAAYFIRDALPIEWQVDSYMPFKYMKDPGAIKIGVHQTNLAGQNGSSTNIQTPLINGISFSGAMDFVVERVSEPNNRMYLTCIVSIIILLFIFIYLLDPLNVIVSSKRR